MPLFRASYKRLEELGLVFCTCGHPPNNHFSWGQRSCAHCPCKKFKRVLIHGLRPTQARSGK